MKNLTKKTQKKQSPKKLLKKTKLKPLINIKGLTEQEVLDTIYRVCKTLSLKFRFGYMTADDIFQEAFIRLTERKKGKPSTLDKYNSAYPLENFLRVVIKNSLINFKRDNFERITELKCKCKFCKSENHEIRLSCNKYKQAYYRTVSKKNVIMPIGITEINDEEEDNAKIYQDIDSNIDKKDIFDKIDKALPVSMRPDYIKMKQGGRIGQIRYEEIMNEIRKIIGLSV